MPKHTSSDEAFETLRQAKADLAAAKKAKASAATIKNLEKAVNNAQAVANLFN